MFLFLDIFSNFFIISVVREKIKVRLALAIPTGVPAILVNKIFDTPSAVAFKTIKASLARNDEQLRVRLSTRLTLF